MRMPSPLAMLCACCALLAIVLGPAAADTNVVEQAKLTAPDGAGGDLFGAAVSVDGDSALVGAKDDDGTGSASVFVRTAGSWALQSKLVPPDGAPGDRFGHAVAVNGDTAVVGSLNHNAGRGAVYVFVRSGSSWSQQAKLTAGDAADGDSFGLSVALDGDAVLVGAPGDDFPRGRNIGSAYVFGRAGSAWSQQAKLASGGSPGDLFGWSVALDGNAALISAYLEDDGGSIGYGLGYDSGSAYVFTRSGTAWTQAAKLTAADHAFQDYFGFSVALDGGSAIIGAYNDDDAGWDSGSAYVFTGSGGSWSQSAKITAPDGGDGDIFGYSVGVSGDVVVVGAPAEDERGTNAGAAYVFSAGAAKKLTATGGEAGDLFGVSVASSGTTVISGAHRDDDRGTDAGAAYVYAPATSTPLPTVTLVPTLPPTPGPTSSPSPTPGPTSSPSPEPTPVPTASAGPQAPVAADDEALTEQYDAVTLDVRVNDSDPRRDGLRVVALSTPSHGVARINSDGTVTYEAGLSFKDADAFTYTVQDSAGRTASARVHIVEDDCGENDVLDEVVEPAVGRAGIELAKAVHQVSCATE